MPTTFYNDPVTRPVQPPPFGPVGLRELLTSTRQGYAWTQGIHLYSELRPVEGLQMAESEEEAQSFLQVIEDYTHAGVQAAALFDLELLEVQGTVLHFHLEGGLDRDAFKKAMAFSYIFTRVLYETLADEMDDEWHGFAICMDHGPAIIVRRGHTSNSSAVSLSEAANKPAKRLLYGRTEAGHAEYPKAWEGKQSDGWSAVNLRDREKAPLFDERQTAPLETKLRQLVNDYRQKRRALPLMAGVPFIQASAMVDAGSFTVDNPLRVQALCMRADLDGFSKQVRAAFQQGEEAVEAIAKGFVKIMEFGDFFEKQHPGCIRLPWAGDCATFLFPVGADSHSFRGKNWIELVEQWQSFASGTDEGRLNRWGKIFANVAWAVGMTYADTGNCLVAPIQTLERRFLTAAGAPLSVALAGQNLCRANETVIHSCDHQALYAPVRKLFDKLEGTEFWRGHKLTMDKVAQAVIDAGRSENVQTFAEKAATISVPTPKPYCK